MTTLQQLSFALLCFHEQPAWMMVLLFQRSFCVGGGQKGHVYSGVFNVVWTFCCGSPNTRPRNCYSLVKSGTNRIILRHILFMVRVEKLMVKSINFFNRCA
jgi:hypothetical protein